MSIHKKCLETVLTSGESNVCNPGAAIETANDNNTSDSIYSSSSNSPITDTTPKASPVTDAGNSDVSSVSNVSANGSNRLTSSNSRSSTHTLARSVTQRALKNIPTTTQENVRESAVCGVCFGNVPYITAPQYHNITNNCSVCICLTFGCFPFLVCAGY